MPPTRSRRPPASIPPTAFDPTTATGRPKPPGPRPSHQWELAFEMAPLRKVATYQMRFEDKVVTDALQSWCHVRYGRALTQWELYSIILAAALSNENSLFAGALEEISAKLESSSARKANR